MDSRFLRLFDAYTKHCHFMFLTCSSRLAKFNAMALSQQSLRGISLRSVIPRNERALPISPMVVNLTKKEDEICSLLEEFCTSRNTDKSGEEPVVCRIAGGWVRDKVCYRLAKNIEKGV
jgi:hypothetical protein